MKMESALASLVRCVCACVMTSHRQGLSGLLVLSISLVQLACSPDGGGDAARSLRAQVLAAAADAGTPNATLELGVFFPHEAGGAGFSAGAGVQLRVDGALMGVTDAEGRARLELPSGRHDVRAILPSLAQGEGVVELAPEAVGTLDILLEDGNAFIAPAQLLIDEATGGVLPNTIESFTLRFERDGAPVALEQLDEVSLLNAAGDFSATLTELFELRDGLIRVTDLATFGSSLGPDPFGELTLLATGVDAAGFTESGTVSFRIGVFRLEGTLLPPPSNPTLDVGGLSVRLTLLGTGISFTRTSDASGAFTLDAVPLGNLELEAETSDGNDYYGQAVLFADADLEVGLTMRNVVDVSSGVPPLTLAPLASAVSAGSVGSLVASARVRPLPRRAPGPARGAVHPPGSAIGIDADDSVSVTVIAEAERATIQATAFLDVPQGTKRVFLKYNVASPEYPFYVLQNSEFNDVWSLSVFAAPGGKRLFQQTRNVNSQLFTPPVWQGDATTGDIGVELDVTELAAAGDTRVTLLASATNVGDSTLSTSVSATLSFATRLTISSIEADSVAGTLGDSSFYSIPQAGETNSLARFFTLGITQPDTATITRVRAVLRGASDLMTVVDEAPGGSNVQLIDDQHLRVRVTLHGTASTLATHPPPAHDITYHFRVEAEDESGPLQDERDSAPRRALWRGRQGFPRYGTPDPGFDDWASRGCYLWLQQHPELITRIDDISGEHARNIGHPSSHQRGIHIDMFHFYTFPGAINGAGNYVLTQAAALAALGGDANALARLRDWAASSRVGLGNLLAASEVSKLFYSIGEAASLTIPANPAQPGSVPRTLRLPRGWARALIRQGVVTASVQAGSSPPVNTPLETGLGIWVEANSDRMDYNSVHNSHVHVELNDALLVH
jgi:hypothetical protein